MDSDKERERDWEIERESERKRERNTLREGAPSTGAAEQGGLKAEAVEAVTSDL